MRGPVPVDSGRGVTMEETKREGRGAVVGCGDGGGLGTTGAGTDEEGGFGVRWTSAPQLGQRNVSPTPEGEILTLVWHCSHSSLPMGSGTRVRFLQCGHLT